MRFTDRLRSFLWGRYGIDGLYYGLLVMFFVLWIARLFCRNIIAAIVLGILQTAVVVWMFYRSFSRNITARRRENEVFMGFFRRIKGFFVLTKNRIRDIKGFRYRKCPHCKAMLRLPRRKGQHSVVCPRCHERFEVKINI